MHTGKYVSPPIRLNVSPGGPAFNRADIEVYGIDQSGPSFEGRVFVNNPAATAKTPPTPENGYAGSFYVYGYGVWPDDVGKDRAAREQEWKDKIRAPITKTIIATDAVRKAAAKSPDITVTVVPVDDNGSTQKDNVLKLEGVKVVLR